MLNSSEAYTKQSTHIVGDFELIKPYETVVDHIYGAIDNLVSEMLFIKRPFARSRLKKTRIICKKIHFQLENNQLISSCKAEKPRVDTFPTDGRISDTEVFGDHFKTTSRISSHKIVQTFWDDSGKSIQIFKLSKDRKTLTLKTRVESEQLPRPLTYKIVYRAQ